MTGNVSPTMVGPMQEETGARRWMNNLMVPMRYAREPEGGDGSADWARLTAADRGADLQWLVDTGGGHEADSIAGAVGRRLWTMVTGAPVWAQHPDTGAFERMLAVRVPAGQAAEMRAIVVAAQTLYMGGGECRIYPMTATRPAAMRIERGPRQVEAVHAAAMAISPGAWRGSTQYGYVVRRAPLTAEGEARDRSGRTEALRHGGVGGWRPDQSMDRPYTCSHTAFGIEIAIWRLREDGIGGQTRGIPERWLATWPGSAVGEA